MVNCGHKYPTSNETSNCQKSPESKRTKFKKSILIYFGVFKQDKNQESRQITSESSSYNIYGCSRAVKKDGKQKKY